MIIIDEEGANHNVFIYNAIVYKYRGRFPSGSWIHFCINRILKNDLTYQ